MTIIDLIDLYAKEKECIHSEFEPEPLFLEQIRPQDLPNPWPADPFPKPPPHRKGSSEKRVIILDI
jgi:hypothetical protein|tara:strand:+ start:253 stop:450 length:198 start_codon:yes stop_codon:yes gene_type:complete